MFIGRERELATLNKLYASDKFEFVVIYGRRRVGKTALISQSVSYTHLDVYKRQMVNSAVSAIIWH